MPKNGHFSHASGPNRIIAVPERGGTEAIRKDLNATGISSEEVICEALNRMG